ncbi:MAG TPA: aminoglycoside phosphotransferase family protein [Microlunatus sp.]|nr:aminoglycoside phosphotransferase family protein [Microlunatus sp.]
MDPSTARRAVTAARSIVTSLGIPADDAVVLQNSNKLTVRLLPGAVLVRIAPEAQQNAQFEIDVARQLASAGAPVAALDPRAEPRPYRQDGFVITVWTYYRPSSRSRIPPTEYARALERLHAGLRRVQIDAPHFTARVAEAHLLIADPVRTPALPSSDRMFLGDALRHLEHTIGERADEQLLHGEPHPGNIVDSTRGLIFVDLETCCRGPIEFDVAHAPDEVGSHYPGLDDALLRDCRALMLAMITTWRWEAGDQFPDGRRLAAEWSRRLRTQLAARSAGRPPPRGTS